MESELLEQDGQAVAAVTYEASLAEQPELVDAVVAAAGLAIRNERLQAELRAEVRLAGTLADTAPSLLTNVDTDGRIIKLNHATLRASGGYEDDADVRGRLFWDVFIDESEREAMVERFVAAAPTSASEYENTFTNLGASGSSSTGGAAPSSTSTARSSASSPPASTSPSGTGSRRRRSASACS